jgi:hypothetical protein
MKTFKQFIKIKDKKEKGEVPSLLISHGKHSQEEKVDDLKDIISSLLVHHGKHSRTLKEEVAYRKKQTRVDTIEPLDHSTNSHIADTVDKVEDELHKHYNYGKLSGPQREELHAYTRSSTSINSHLHYVATGKSEPSERLAPAIKTLDAVTRKHKLKTKLTTYSGVRFNPGEEASKNEGREIHLPAYTSSSLKASEARMFAREDDNNNSHMVRFNMPKGHGGFHVGRNSNHRDEHEFLIPRNTRWRIAEHPEVHPHPTAEGRNVHIWNAHPAD